MKIHGRRGKVEIGSASPYENIGSLNAWNLGFTRDKVDVTSFQENNKTYLVGLKDVSGGFEGFFDTSYIRSLAEAAESETGTNVRITPSTDHPEFYFEGPAWLDLTANGAVNDAVKISGTISANGDWLQVLDGSPVA